MNKYDRYPKHIKRRLRQIADIAYEKELRQHLEHLSSKFDAWKHNKLSSWDLIQLIHEFHNGASRELYNTYNSNFLTPDLLVAQAVAKGIISESEANIPEEIREDMRDIIRFFKDKG